MSGKFTLAELRGYNGEGADGKVFVALNGKIYDVTEDKSKFGAGGPVTVYAGRDATRGMAKMSVECVKDGTDDLSDLNEQEWERVRGWEVKFAANYNCVGSLKLD